MSLYSFKNARIDGRPILTGNVDDIVFFSNVFLTDTDPGYAWNSVGKLGITAKTSNTVTLVEGTFIVLEVDQSNNAIRISSNITANFAFSNVYLTDTDVGYSWQGVGNLGITTSNTHNVITLVEGSGMQFDVDQTNVSIRITTGAFDRANIAFNTANLALNVAQSAFNQANNAYNIAQNSFNTANTANIIPRIIQMLVTDPQGSSLSNVIGVLSCRINSVLNNYNLTAVAASVTNVSTSGLPTVNLVRMRNNVAANMLSTMITIDANEFDSSTAATPAVINTANAMVLTADQIRVDVNNTGTGAKGLIVELTFTKP
jgi:hypothetical protein